MAEFPEIETFLFGDLLLLIDKENRQEHNFINIKHIQRNQQSKVN